MILSSAYSVCMYVCMRITIYLSGAVGNLTFGRTFGEIALKEINALRTATVTAVRGSLLCVYVQYVCMYVCMYV
jgi:hypothetical protein